jgi:uncharacterized protein YecE (DUF72 family)
VIRVGIAGWDYPDWNGVVYPSRASRGFDRLAHVAQYVDCVEINSSFYRPLSPRTAEAWVRRTERFGHFCFTAKSHRSWTHERAADLDAAIQQTLTGLAPLRQAGRLGALLVQFPQSFHHTPAATDHLDRLLEPLDGWPTVVEVRHRSWEEHAADAWFRDRSLGWCAVDQPHVGATARVLPRVSSDVGYLRLHGRNAANWFRPDAGRDARYDYLYSDAELRDLAATVESMASTTREMFVIQNNHFRGQALVNALQMKHLLEEVPPLAPEDLVIHYPQLERHVSVRREKLF